MKCQALFPWKKKKKMLSASIVISALRINKNTSLHRNISSSEETHSTLSWIIGEILSAVENGLKIFRKGGDDSCHVFL